MVSTADVCPPSLIVKKRTNIFFIASYYVLFKAKFVNSVRQKMLKVAFS